MTSTIAPYGSWNSPLSADKVARSGTGSGALPREIQIDGTTIYWVEIRPEEGGRYVIVKLEPDGSTTVMTPDDFNVRSRVHEYGGGVYCVHDGRIVFVNDHDQRLYLQEQGRRPYAITPQPAKQRTMRYADGVFSPDGKWMIWVQEQHASSGQIQNGIVLIPTDGSSPPRGLASGHDFFSNPRFSPDGRMICWLSWDQPCMPWDGTELWTARFEPYSPEELKPIKVAGGNAISIFQPEWSPNGILYFVSDQTGWWNLYRRTENGRLENVYPAESEFGYPQWLFGFTTYTFLPEERVFACFKTDGQAQLGLIDTRENSMQRLQHPFTSFENPSVRADRKGSAWFFAGAPDHQPSLYRFDSETLSTQVALDLSEELLDPEDLSRPEQIEFVNKLGSKSFAYFYPPENKLYAGPAGEKPPLIVKSHGGPTSSARRHLQLEIQFWTSRGFALVDVDYSGSVGYGRAYRERLNYRMGDIDVDDCVRAAEFLIERGSVDPDRLIARGGSAGGYVTLCALTFYELFSAGCSYYGIADLEGLAKHSHKFEAHYLDQLIGPYPERKDLYRQRSPIHHMHQLSCPMIVFQGLDDNVVPPEQSEKIASALDENGLEHVYMKFENEGHGFKRSETIQAALEAELSFYRRVFAIPGQDSARKK